MAVVDLIKNKKDMAFSFELLPPVKGNGIESLYSTIDILKDFDPQYINITTHCSENVYKEVKENVYQRNSYCRRPCTVAIAAAIQNKYGIPVVPHVICSGFSREDIEYTLLDLQFLGITDLLVLRGEKSKDDKTFRPKEGGWSHASQLEQQINDFNSGRFIDGSDIHLHIKPFHYGVGCYPEKHIEAPNKDKDIYWLKKKIDAGAGYAVTQMFFDNKSYFDFVERARKNGITVPIIPGVKPLTKASQLTRLPHAFNVSFPQELVDAVKKCGNDEDVERVGKEWCINQCRELISKNVPSIHFYTMGHAENVADIVRTVY